MPRSERVFVDFKAIKQSVTILQVLEHYGVLQQMRRNGDSLAGRCPIHKGQNATAFRVSVSKNCWNCFSDCKAGGNILDFVSRMEGVEIHGAALKIADWFNIAFEEPKPRDRDRFKAPAKSKQDPPVHSPVLEEAEESGEDNPPLKFSLQQLEPCHPYLQERGMKAETIATFGLGYCKKGILAGHIAIPIHNPKGELVAYAGRWPGTPTKPDSKYRFPKGFRKGMEVFNLHRAAQASADHPLVIVEGFFDCMNLWQAGVQRVVSLMGSTMSEAQDAQLSALLTTGQKVALLLDEDQAGRNCREQLLQRFSSKAFVRVIALGAEGKQPDQLSPDEISALEIRETSPGYSTRPAVLRLGRLVSTPNALESIPQHEILAAIARHQSGDWGDLSEEDRQANERALADRSRLLSVYHSLAGVKFYLITEADRSCTTVLLPEDY